MVSLRHQIRLGVATLACAGALACDGGAHPPDAQTQASLTSAELSIRFEVSANGPPTVSVLGFRAAMVAGAGDSDVLGLVDPLSAAAPPEGCALRDVDLAASALGTRGGSVDLEELGGVGVGLGPGESPNESVIRLFPRVYPDVAGVIGGVVAEAGPQPLTALPEQVTLYSPDAELAVANLAVPALPHLLTINGSTPTPGARVDASGGLTLAIGGAAGAIVEVRPFGATVAVSCSVPANASTEAMVVIPPALIAHLPRTAVSIEVARRARLRAPLASAATRVSVEIRSALAVELRP